MTTIEEIKKLLYERRVVNAERLFASNFAQIKPDEKLRIFPDLILALENGNHISAQKRYLILYAEESSQNSCYEVACHCYEKLLALDYKFALLDYKNYWQVLYKDGRRTKAEQVGAEYLRGLLGNKYWSISESFLEEYLAVNPDRTKVIKLRKKICVGKRDCKTLDKIFDEEMKNQIVLPISKDDQEITHELLKCGYWKQSVVLLASAVVDKHRELNIKGALKNLEELLMLHSDHPMLTQILFAIGRYLPLNDFLDFYKKEICGEKPKQGILAGQLKIKNLKENCESKIITTLEQTKINVPASDKIDSENFIESFESRVKLIFPEILEQKIDKDLVDFNPCGLLTDQEMKLYWEDLITAFNMMKEYSKSECILKHLDQLHNEELSLSEMLRKEYLRIEIYRNTEKKYEALAVIDRVVNLLPLDIKEKTVFIYLSAQIHEELMDYKNALLLYQIVKKVEPGYRSVERRIEELADKE